MSISEELVSQISELLEEAKLSKEHLLIERCGAGGNNRTYRVQTRDGVFAAKSYFSHSGDLRDRLGAEFSFLSYAQQVANKMVPKPYAQKTHHKIALYEFIEGRTLAPGEVAETELNEAINFFCLLNSPLAKKLAAPLANASEACFSIEEHVNLIGARIKQLQQIPSDTEEMKTAQHYAKKLNDIWSNLIDRIHEATNKDGLNLSFPLDVEQRCISPSDFGFHNALREPDGAIRFLDFEYAGWDDPAKMAGDFFAQIAVPVPESFFESFIIKTMQVFPNSEDLIKRAKILRPAYQVKWCCIALNVFVPYHLARRKFADSSLDVLTLHRSQLAKVELLMKPLEKKYGL